MRKYDFQAILLIATFLLIDLNPYIASILNGKNKLLNFNLIMIKICMYCSDWSYINDGNTLKLMFHWLSGLLGYISHWPYINNGNTLTFHGLQGTSAVSSHHWSCTNPGNFEASA